MLLEKQEEGGKYAKREKQFMILYSIYHYGKIATTSSKMYLVINTLFKQQQLW
jgi:hypothetical protein